jgi:hypothetical protein
MKCATIQRRLDYRGLRTAFAPAGTGGLGVTRLAAADGDDRASGLR